MNGASQSDGVKALQMARQKKIRSSLSADVDQCKVGRRDASIELLSADD